MLGSILQPVSLGIMLGLLLGKQIGIFLFAQLAVRTGLATLPRELTWKQVYGVGWLAGIGFTMSLFIAQLAFPESLLLTIAKGSILLASLIAGLGSWVVFRLFVSPQSKQERPT
jgi:NhaA family Na+:H+ antiporter